MTTPKRPRGPVDDALEAAIATPEWARVPPADEVPFRLGRRRYIPHAGRILPIDGDPTDHR